MARKKKEIEELPLATPLQIEQKSIQEIATNAYCEFGDYINNHRHLADLDGWKVSYRRLIYILLTQFSHTSFNHTNTAIAACASIHPHGIAAFNEMAANLVKSGIFAGEGAFGFTQIDGVVNPPANERYTYIRVSDLYWELIGDLIKEVPYVESPNGNPEPSYIPGPLPYGLMTKFLSQGLGVSMSMLYPNFSPWSMYRAYMTDNPNLLEPNVDLILDKNNSELKLLWEEGRGRVVYSYKISRYTNPTNKMEGILFETKDGTDIFTPRLKPLKKLVDDGKVYIEDLTDYDSCKMVVYRIPGARGISIDDIESICRKCCYSASKYVLNVTNGQSAFRIPLKAWIDFTYKRYIQLITEANQKKIAKVKFEIAVQEAIPLISEYIINKNPKASDEELCRTLGLSEIVVQKVMEKSISNLRKNKDNADKIKALKAKLKELKAFNPVQYTEEIIKKM